MKVLTLHAKNRLKSRTNIVRYKHRNNLFKKATIYGKSPSDYKIKCPRMYQYMIKRAKYWYKVKHYAGYIFIHRGAKLITMYEEPKWFKSELLKNEKLKKKVGKKI